MSQPSGQRKQHSALLLTLRVFSLQNEDNNLYLLPRWLMKMQFINIGKALADPRRGAATGVQGVAAKAHPPNLPAACSKQGPCAECHLGARCRHGTGAGCTRDALAMILSYFPECSTNSLQAKRALLGTGSCFAPQSTQVPNPGRILHLSLPSSSLSLSPTPAAQACGQASLCGALNSALPPPRFPCM